MRYLLEWDVGYGNESTYYHTLEAAEKWYDQMTRHGSIRFVRLSEIHIRKQYGARNGTTR